MAIMGSGRRCWANPVRWQAFSCMYLLVTAAVILSCACKAVAGLATNDGQAGSTQAAAPPESNALLFAEPLYGDGTTFVASRVKAALAAGTPSSDLATIAAEAAAQISWSECSRFCNGGSQTADNERALKLAIEGLRRAFSNSGKWSDSYALEVEKKIAQFTMDGDPAAGQVKTRPCNTFRCPFEVPTDLKSANLQIAREPELVASLGVVPQVEFTDACKDRLMLDQIDQQIWTARRNEHLNYRKVQEHAGEIAGWEATVLAPEQLSLYSCVTLCRLHHRCSALIYAEDILGMQMNKGGSLSEDAKGDAINALQSAMRNADSVMESLVGSLASLSERDGDSVRLNSRSENPVCTLYTGVKASRVAECGIEPTKKADKNTLALLVINLDMDFGDAARVMRASLAQKLERMKSVLSDASLLVNSTGTKNSKAATFQQRAERLTSRVIRVTHRAQVASYILPQAVRVMEEAALNAAEALHDSQSVGQSTAQVSRLGAGENETALRSTDGSQRTFYSATPLSTSCSVFSGIELLNRGCVQLPALQTHSSTLSSKSSVDAAESQQTSEDANVMTWQKCQDVLKNVAHLLDKYRTAVSQIQESGEETTIAAKEAKRLLPLILGLSVEETAKLSLPDISDRLQAETGLMNKDFAKFLDEKDALEVRREVVERLGEGNGTIFAVFNTAKQVCEIRAVFEPRHAENGNTLGAQFPSACASFNPFSVTFLLAESSDSGSTTQESEAYKTRVCTLEDVSCAYSPWTSWSPCYDSYQLDGFQTDESRNNAEVEPDSAGQYRSAMWQVRVKETLARPKVAIQCDAAVEARLCKHRVTAATEASGLMGGFTAAISKLASNLCIYSPYSEWSECSPKCSSDDISGITAYKTRTRTVHQHPVPGLASRCDTASLEMQKACGTVPSCSGGVVEERKVDTTGDHIEKGFDRGSYTAPSAIHLQSYAKILDPEESAREPLLLNPIVRRSFEARISPSSGPRNDVAEAEKVPVGHLHTKAFEGTQESFLVKSHEGLLVNETVEQPLDKPAFRARTEDEPLATLKDSISVEGERSQDPDSKLPPIVAAANEDGDILSSAAEESNAEAPIENSDTRSLTAVRNSAAARPTEDESAHDPPVVSEPQEEPLVMPYDSPFIEDGVAQKRIGEESAWNPAVEGKNHESAMLTHPVLTIPYDSPLGDNKSGSSPGTMGKSAEALDHVPIDMRDSSEGSMEPSKHTPEGDAAASESFFLGLSCFSFVGCCVFGGLASTVLVLITVVCSRRIRSWLGYDWSGATEEERMALLKKHAGACPQPVAAPLVNPDGIKVLKPDGASLVVSPCLNHSGGQYVTPNGSKIFVTVEGGFVNSWGKPVQANELPKELLAKVDEAQLRKPVPFEPLPVTINVQGHASGLSASSGPPSKVLGMPQQAVTAQGKQIASGAAPKKVGPEPKQIPEVRRSSAVPQINAKKPGMPPPKAPGSG
ncbi:hypothetical protein, conserved [Eimeria praecox]|uniref:Thrombospondin type 1 domain-containing protein n=1 Tax=Eimeria praecox TaxID=51316 RepID=U6GT43_9EIME|nr:hypothetical protein, conserved [Eimeria praecox]